MLIDTHCHLYLPEFDADRAAMIQRARDKGIDRFYLPAIDSSVISSMMELEESCPGCYPMMGLHPCSVKENYQDELQIVAGWLAKRKFVAIGEIGLDFYWDTTFTEQQYAAFRFQMELALKYSLPIVIHSRNAIRECIDTVKPFAAKGLKGIFHCFGDSIELAREIISMDFFLGIGGVITYKKSGLADVIKEISLDHIVLETDAPYLTPVPFRGKRNESSYISYVAEKIAEVKNITVAEVSDNTSANARNIFGNT
jgi:TatD DNase family protein